MKKENFKELISDLYLAYNPHYLKHVDFMVDKWHRMEFDFVQNVLTKYNHNSYKHYDPAKAEDEWIHQLIKDYSNDNKTLKGNV